MPTLPVRCVIPLLLALALVRCSAACFDRGAWEECFYELRPACGPHEAPCVDSERVTCSPRFKSLGPWAPVPLDYQPAPSEVPTVYPSPASAQ